MDAQSQNQGGGGPDTASGSFTDGFSFSAALQALKDGCAVGRAKWKNVAFIVLMPELQLPAFNTQDTNRKVNDRTAKWIGPDTPLNSRPYIAAYTPDGEWQPGWLASQADLLADDWVIVKSAY